MILSILIWLISTNPYSSHSDGVAITRMAVHIIKRETKITLRPHYRDITRRKVNAFRFKNNSCTGLEMYCDYLRSSGMTAILTEPLIDKGNRYFYGLANGICRLRGGSCQVGVQRIRTNGTDGMRYSAYALAHEILHLLGSNQDSSRDCSLGDTNILHCLGASPIHLNKKSKAQVSMCLKRSRWW